MTSISDLDNQIERLKKCEYLKESEVKVLCDKAREILIDESNVQSVNAPVTVSSLILNVFHVYSCRFVETFMANSLT